MGNIYQILTGLILFSAGAVMGAQSSIAIDGKQYWLNGINLPWIHWEDFDDPWGSSNYNHEDFDAAFKKYAENGINSVRVWVHCAGEGSPVLDAEGNVTGAPEIFWDNFGDMLSLAAQHGLFVMPALFSFDILKQQRTIIKYQNNTAANFHAFIASETKTQTYIDNFLIPLLARFDTSRALFLWEICNEPEWMSETEGASSDDVIRFHAQIAAAIHQYGTKPVTTGSASLKWHGVQFDGWSNEALQAQFNDPRAYFDVYQIHYYDWMDPSGNDDWGFSPWHRSPDDLGLGDRPVIIGECPGDGGLYMTATEMYEDAYNLGYAGVFAWSDFAGDGVGVFADISPATNYMSQNYPDQIAGIPVSLGNRYPPAVPAPASLSAQEGAFIRFLIPGTNTAIDSRGRRTLMLPPIRNCPHSTSEIGILCSSR